jgi:Uma2 family endonuclease
MSSPMRPGQPALPAVDERLVAPESGYEIDDGKVVYVPPSDEPHGTRHSKAAALFEAHASDEYDVACDMLTRTSELNDRAPDVSVFPRARHPETGGRQLEEIAVEIVSTQSISDAGRKARELAERGVRRVLAIDVERARGFEWSRAVDGWQILAEDATIEDRCLAVALPIAALVSAAKADDAIARALIAKHNPVIGAALTTSRAEGKAEGKAESVLAVLQARGVSVNAEERARISSQRDLATLAAWLDRAATCTTASALFAESAKL